MSAFVASKLSQRADSRPSNLKPDTTSRSVLEVFEDPYFRLALKALFEGLYEVDEASTDRTTKIISHDVAACLTEVVGSLGSLRVVEIGVKLMKVLPQQHHSKILKVVDSQILRLALAYDLERDRYGRKPTNPASIDAGDDGFAQGGTQTSRELTAVAESHEEVYWGFRHRLLPL